MNSKHLNSCCYAPAFQPWFCCATVNNSEVMERWGSERAAAIFVSLRSVCFLLGGSVVTTETGEGWHGTGRAGVGLVGLLSATAHLHKWESLGLACPWWGAFSFPLSLYGFVKLNYKVDDAPKS